MTGLSALARPGARPPAGFRILDSGFIVPAPSFASSHASTIVETPSGLVAAWFGGTGEGAPDVGIWLSRGAGRTWLAPMEVATGVAAGDSRRYPCWNPVLFRRRSGELLLFYKVGPAPASWWGMLKTSADDGRTWSEARRLPAGILGPIKNKPVELPDGTLLCGSSAEDGGWRVRMEWTRDPAGAWSRGADLNDPPAVSAIQPALLRFPNGILQALCRSKQGVLMETWGKTADPSAWTRLAPTRLPNPDSGIDAVTLADGRAVLVYNPLKEGRGILDVAYSLDGREWLPACRLEDEPGKEYSYPAVIQTRDGRLHVTYTWRRTRIKHVVLDPGVPPK
ncbi:MAG: exo-alpha-sialidase [Acidobacteriota bacterium]|nr:exo-alpha-sialidase [Acidobacteriota bacterium]